MPDDWNTRLTEVCEEFLLKVDIDNYRHLLPIPDGKYLP